MEETDTDVLVLGPSESGKTTLINRLNGTLVILRHLCENWREPYPYSNPLNPRSAQT